MLYANILETLHDFLQDLQLKGMALNDNGSQYYIKQILEAEHYLVSTLLWCHANRTFMTIIISVPPLPVLQC